MIVSPVEVTCIWVVTHCCCVDEHIAEHDDARRMEGKQKWERR